MPTAIAAVLLAAAAVWQRFIIQINIKNNSDRAASGELGRGSSDRSSVDNNNNVQQRQQQLLWPFCERQLQLASFHCLCCCCCCCCWGWRLPLQLLVSILADICGDLKYKQLSAASALPATKHKYLSVQMA